LAFRFSTPAVPGAPELQSAFLDTLAPHWFATSEDDTRTFSRVNRVRVFAEAGAARRGVARLSAEGELLLTGRDRAAIVELTKRIAEWNGRVEPGLLFTID
jgi:hypothetical protein